MADKYWYKTSSDAKWDTLVTGETNYNWWTTAAHDVGAAAIPVDGDDVYILGTTPPDWENPTTTPVALHKLDTTGYTGTGEFGWELTEVVTIQEGGFLLMGGATDEVMWGGLTGQTGTFIFYSGSLIVNSGATGRKVGDYAVFNGTSYGGSAQAAAIGDYATFNDTSYGGNVGNYATFNDTSTAAGPVGDYATFNDASCVSNETTTVGNYATFNDSSYAQGTIGNYATFNDDAANYGTVGTYATFNHESFNFTAFTVGDHATINSTYTQDGTWSGTHYFIGAAVSFANTALFTGTAPIVFELINSSASVVGKFTTNGGTTPKQVQITVRPDPKVIII